MTKFIRDEGLLDPLKINRIVAETPAELVELLDVATAILLAERPTMGSWIERFKAGATARAPGSHVGLTRDPSIKPRRQRGGGGALCGSSADGALP